MSERGDEVEARENREAAHVALAGDCRDIDGRIVFRHSTPCDRVAALLDAKDAALAAEQHAHEETRRQRGVCEAEWHATESALRSEVRDHARTQAALLAEQRTHEETRMRLLHTTPTASQDVWRKHANNLEKRAEKAEAGWQAALDARKDEAIRGDKAEAALTDTRRKLDEARAFLEMCQRAHRCITLKGLADFLARLDTPASTPVAGEACRCVKGDGHEPHVGRCGRMVDMEDFEAPCRCKGTPTPDTTGTP